jgi:hypothetical protein
VVLIGFSRMYLDVHYLSDVLAGYAAGGAWLSALVTGVETVRRSEKEAKFTGRTSEKTLPRTPLNKGKRDNPTRTRRGLLKRRAYSRW